MFNPVRNILRSATRRETDKLNILTFVTHSPFECELTKTDHIFYGWRDPDGRILDWNTCRDIPDNYVVLDRSNDSIPDVDFDLVLSQSIEAHYPYARHFANLMQIPLVSIYHTTPPVWNQNCQQYVNAAKQQCISDVNVFITQTSMEMWGYSESNRNVVIHHAANTRDFKPLGTERQKFVMYTCNALRERDYACGWNIWRTITDGLPSLLVGKDPDPNVSKPIQDPTELNSVLNKCGVYLNASTNSPFPMSLIEAAMAGCPIVSTATLEIPIVFTHRDSAYLFPPDRPELGKKYVEHLLNNPDEAARLGKRAREVALEFFNPDKFVSRWRDVFRSVTQ